MLNVKIGVVVMSGLEDGTTFKCETIKGDGIVQDHRWILTIGRQEHCDIRLSSDNYISRNHAKLHYVNGQWWLEDCDSRNGTFISQINDFLRDSRVRNLIPVEIGQLFRIGRTWLRLHPIET